MNIVVQTMHILVQAMKNVGPALNIPVQMITKPRQTMTKPGITMNIIVQLVNFGVQSCRQPRKINVIDHFEKNKRAELY
jgi:hypothetical protein